MYHSAFQSAIVKTVIQGNVYMLSVIWQCQCCHSSRCHSAKCHSALLSVIECLSHGDHCALFNFKSVILLSVILLSVILLRVVWWV